MAERASETPRSAASSGTSPQEIMTGEQVALRTINRALHPYDWLDDDELRVADRHGDCPLARMVPGILDALRSLPVEQRMEAMGMRVVAERSRDTEDDVDAWWYGDEGCPAPVFENGEKEQLWTTT